MRLVARNTTDGWKLAQAYGPTIDGYMYNGVIYSVTYGYRDYVLYTISDLKNQYSDLWKEFVEANSKLTDMDEARYAELLYIISRRSFSNLKNIVDVPKRKRREVIGSGYAAYTWPTTGIVSGNTTVGVTATTDIGITTDANVVSGSTRLVPDYDNAVEEATTEPDDILF